LFLVNESKLDKGVFVSDEGIIYALVYDIDPRDRYKCYLINLDTLELLVMYEEIPSVKVIEEEIGEFKIYDSSKLAIHIRG
jgi:hypothetical protein